LKQGEVLYLILSPTEGAKYGYVLTEGLPARILGRKRKHSEGAGASGGGGGGVIENEH